MMGTNLRRPRVSLISYYRNFVAPYLKAHVASERGASLVEYALLIALIAIVAIGVLTTLGGNASKKFSQAANSLT